MDEYLQILSEQDSCRFQKEVMCNISIWRWSRSDLVEIGQISSSNWQSKVFIEANVVKNELPLLLSRQSMKRAEMIIDFSNDTVNVGGKDIIELTCTSSGHYCLPLTRLLLHDSFHIVELFFMQLI